MQIVDSNQVIRADIDDIIGYDLPWQCLEKKVVMISGGSGFLASYVVKSLLSANDLYGLGLEIICVVLEERRPSDAHLVPDQMLQKHGEGRVVSRTPRSPGSTRRS